MNMDQKEFQLRVSGIRNRIQRFALTMLHQKQEAEDVMQEVLMKLWINRKSIPQIDNLEAYAMKITKNLCLDKIKGSKNKKMIDLNETNAGWENFTPFSKVSFQNLRELMLQLFSTLPEQQRMIIHMRDIEHFSFEEIENITGMNVNAIRVNLSRARKSVRSNYLKIKAYETK
jgi:RNA polymerase sigma-70 factor (ECF subfamily)